MGTDEATRNETTATVPTNPASSVLEAVEATEMPKEIADSFQRLMALESPPETVGEGMRAVERRMVGGDFEITVDQWFQSEVTRHALHFGNRVEHVPCVLDALMAALCIDRKPVDIHSEPPDGERAVHLQVTDSKVSAEPSSVVFSWGFAADDVRQPGSVHAGDDQQDLWVASCSYMNAFPDSAAFERWKEGVSGGVVLRLGLEAMVAYSRRAADKWVTGP